MLGILPGVMGTLQATEVIKLVLGLGEAASGRLLHYDALALAFTSFHVARDSQCAICGAQPSITDLVDYDAFCGAGAAADSLVPQLSPAEAHEMLEHLAELYYDTGQWPQAITVYQDLEHGILWPNRAACTSVGGPISPPRIFLIRASARVSSMVLSAKVA